MDDFDALKQLDKFADDAAFQEKFAAVKRANKARLADDGRRSGSA